MKTKDTKDVEKNIVTEVRKSIQSAVKPIESKVDMLQGEIQPLTSKVDKLHGEMGSLKTEVGKIRMELKPMRSDMGKMRKDIDTMLSLFDREYIDLRQRVERIEEHLNLSSNPSGN